jgi:hypothetical protein
MLLEVGKLPIAYVGQNFSLPSAGRKAIIVPAKADPIWFVH